MPGRSRRSRWSRSATPGGGFPVYGNAFAEVFPRAISEVNQQMARVTVLLVVIGVIMVRPTGLFTTRGRVYD